jgi:hypothetical protein
MRVFGVVLAAVLASGCADAFTSRVDAVARAGAYQLPVEQAAEMIATGKGLPLQREVVEGVAVLWVDYTLFANRLLAGDSLLDSTLVAKAMWADIQQEIANEYHDQLIGGAAKLDSAQLDSAYDAGQERVIKHILFRVNADASPDVRAAKRRLAEDTYRKLASGRITWSKAVELSEDPGSKENDGSLGVIQHGQYVPAFENVAFALKPGEMSQVTESPFGYHIIYRPPLPDVRDEFRKGVEGALEDKFDEAYLTQLPEKWEIEVRGGVGPAVREVGQDPLRAKQSGKVLGTYRGGRFRVSDFAKWLQAMPVEVRQQLAAASDSQITAMVRSLIRNEVLIREAKAAGVTVSPEFMGQVKDQLRRQLALISALIGFRTDSLAPLRALPPSERETLVKTHVLGYLSAVAQNEKRLQTIPPFLADELRAESDWKLIPAGVERVLDRARQIRLSLDTIPKRPDVTPPTAQPPRPVPVRPPSTTRPGTSGN